MYWLFPPMEKLWRRAHRTRPCRVWDLQSGTQRYVLQGHTGRITSLQFIPGEERLISASDSEADGRARIWDLRIGRELVTLPAPFVVVDDMAFDPVGRRLAVTSSRGIALWEAADRASADSQKPSSPRAKVLNSQIALPSDSDVRALGFVRMKELFQHDEPAKSITPERADHDFLVAVVSVPYERLYPTAKQYRKLQEKHLTDPEEKPAGPRRSYALYDPLRFKLLAPDGSARTAAAVSPFGFGSAVGFKRKTILESSTLSHNPRDRAMMLIAWEAGHGEDTRSLRIACDGNDTIALPNVKFDRYRGDTNSGSAARQAGPRIRGANALREQRYYSDF